MIAGDDRTLVADHKHSAGIECVQVWEHWTRGNVVGLIEPSLSDHNNGGSGVCTDSSQQSPAMSCNEASITELMPR